MQYTHGVVKICFSAGAFFQLFDKRNKLHSIINWEQLTVQLHQLCHISGHGPVFFTAILSPFQNLLLDIRLVSHLAGCPADGIVDTAKFLCKTSKLSKGKADADCAKCFSCKAFYFADSAFCVINRAFIDLEQNLIDELSDYSFLRRHLCIPPSVLLAFGVLNVPLHHNQVVEF